MRVGGVLTLSLKFNQCIRDPDCLAVSILETSLGLYSFQLKLEIVIKAPPPAAVSLRVDMMGLIVIVVLRFPVVLGFGTDRPGGDGAQRTMWQLCGFAYRQHAVAAEGAFEVPRQPVS